MQQNRHDGQAATTSTSSVGTWEFKSQHGDTSDLYLAFSWLSCQVPGAMISVVRRVGPWSVYCDCVRFVLYQCGNDDDFIFHVTHAQLS